VVLETRRVGKLSPAALILLNGASAPPGNTPKREKSQERREDITVGNQLQQSPKPLKSGLLILWSRWYPLISPVRLEEGRSCRGEATWSSSAVEAETNHRAPGQPGADDAAPAG